jgi:hypothetical protein
MSASTKGRITFRAAAVLFFLSALFEIFSITSGVALLGAVRGGAVAVIWHLLYFSLFLGLGVGLWQAKPWGYKLVFIGTVFYTLDNVSTLFYREFMKTWLIQQLGRHADILQFVGIELVIQMVTLMMLLFVACWWGFAGYTYLRRAYFGPGRPPELPPQNQTRA